MSQSQVQANMQASCAKSLQATCVQSNLSQWDKNTKKMCASYPNLCKKENFIKDVGNIFNFIGKTITNAKF